MRAQNYEDAITAELLPGWRQADGSHVAAVRMVLKEGWKTYWRAPGDGGIPPQLRWAGSRNMQQIEVIWPTPTVFDQNGLQSLGYLQEVVVPLIVAPTRAGRDISLNARLDIGVCKEICVPETLRIKARLPEENTKIDPMIAAALAERPYSAQEAGVQRVACKISANPEGLSVSADIQMPSAGGREFAVIETDNPELWVAQADANRRGATLSVSSDVYHVEDQPFLLSRDALRFTVLGQNYAVDIHGCQAG
ncbi:protein-disulfide reductase DsbD domain-containing protein [Cognatishimia sp. WU-CL00825]|uniref:protein-disulfide reductase DsbD domain-containing protein n=1 Tax=Cognatishimia sp. WU-CL00825 TaxID=3127658 RepID=UPI00336539AD